MENNFIKKEPKTEKLEWVAPAITTLKDEKTSGGFSSSNVESKYYYPVS